MVKVLHSHSFDNFIFRSLVTLEKLRGKKLLHLVFARPELDTVYEALHSHLGQVFIGIFHTRHELI